MSSTYILLCVLCVRRIDFVYVSTIYCVCCVLGVSTLSMFLLFKIGFWNIFNAEVFFIFHCIGAG